MRVYDFISSYLFRRKRLWSPCYAQGNKALGVLRGEGAVLESYAATGECWGRRRRVGKDGDSEEGRGTGAGILLGESGIRKYT